MSSEKVLVLNATGKVGKNVCIALREAGFDVFGTTRSQIDRLKGIGITPVICNYTDRQDLERVFEITGARKVLSITDYFGAARSNGDREIQHGNNAIDAAKKKGVDHFIFVSVVDAEYFNDHVRHIKTKLVIEDYLRQSGLPYSILRPAAFFENFDDPRNWNPLKKGAVKFLSEKKIKYCSTYDIGRAAAIMFKNPQIWLGKTLDVISWEGTLSDVAKALEKVGGVPVKARLAMPLLLRRILLKDLHNMFLYFESGGPKGTPDEFKKVLANALSAEDWFRFHGRYSNGDPI
ncbi:NmrA family NAD(P)-binding protein [Rhizobiales bacterium TNE-4]|nr:NmrA family NAD(P)-binding protein [Rhizobiales bacterium TNE-4]MBV1829005.1 NmrA family NAD(P)-binding protein [Rhizobiales bacterium TNE-4]